MILTSVIIVNHNAATFLNDCLNSIFKTNIKNAEIIVVDNHSQDNSLKLVEKYIKTIGKEILHIVKLDQNYGPAFARNAGAKLAKGKYIGFLDNDTKVHKNWLVSATAMFEQNKNIGIIQCKLILESGKIDSLGEFLGTNGFLVQKTTKTKSFILAAKSAAMFIRKETFEKIGGFDPDYFIYLEETDLSWRSWLSGYKNLFLPDSLVYHNSGTSSIILGKNRVNELGKFHGTKNYIMTLIKNLATLSLIKILPQHIFLWIGLAIYKLVQMKFLESYWIIKAIIWNLSNLRATLRKRYVIQRSRKINDKTLFKIVMKKRPFSYYLKKATVKHKIGYAESF